jgi:hypothetical protein
MTKYVVTAKKLISEIGASLGTRQFEVDGITRKEAWQQAQSMIESHQQWSFERGWTHEVIISMDEGQIGIQI